MGIRKRMCFNLECVKCEWLCTQWFATCHRACLCECAFVWLCSRNASVAWVNCSRLLVSSLKAHFRRKQANLLSFRHQKVKQPLKQPEPQKCRSMGPIIQLHVWPVPYGPAASLSSLGPGVQLPVWVQAGKACLVSRFLGFPGYEMCLCGDGFSPGWLQRMLGQLTPQQPSGRSSPRPVSRSWASSGRRRGYWSGHSADLPIERASEQATKIKTVYVLFYNKVLTSVNHFL